MRSLPRRRQTAYLFTLAALLAIPSFATEHREHEVSFNRDIRPILSGRCYFCHGFDEDHREADLRLDVEEASRQVITPGVAEDSELMRRIISSDEFEMMPPPDAHKKALTEDEIAMIRLWIDQGAVYQKHWSFVAPKRARLSELTEEDRHDASKVIDHFVGQAHQQRGLSFAKPAKPAKWLRRACLDLTGLPPTEQQMRDFEREVSGRGEAAYEDVIDRVLQSPHFGERMALDWLDVARYADTNGYQHDGYRMNWPWRDWVVQAFNENMPFDQFTVEQLAGDLLEEPSQSQLIATAFNRNHMINAEGGSILEENLAKTVFDRVETTGTAWLGLTVGCSQCHDHKFDPIKQQEYYQLFAFFNQVDETFFKEIDATMLPPGNKHKRRYMIDRPYLELASEELLASAKQAKEHLEKCKILLKEKRPEFEPLFKKWILEMRDDPSLIKQRVKEQFARRFVNSIPLNNPKNGNTARLTRLFLLEDTRWAQLIRDIDQAKQLHQTLDTQITRVMIMRDNKPRETFVLDRGNYETPTNRVSADVPEFLPALPEGHAANRLALAEWLVAEQNPLTSRVTVNRFWQLLFGRGIVASPDDFGLQGEYPSHPELLDWLAVEFRETGWDVKGLLRAIVLSKTYRQSAQVSTNARDSDPDNRWLSRGPRQRLDSRLLRDQALAISGLLVPAIGGAPVFPYQPPGIWEALSLDKNRYEEDRGDNLYRRSLYTVWRRVVAPANFFDVASRQSCSVKPRRTNTPLHALTLLNDITYVEAARVWASKLACVEGDSDRLRSMFYAATARTPTKDELDTLQATLDEARGRFVERPESAEELLSVGAFRSPAELDQQEHAAWATVCLLVLNLDETLCK